MALINYHKSSRYSLDIKAEEKGQSFVMHTYEHKINADKKKTNFSAQQLH